MRPGTRSTAQSYNRQQQLQTQQDDNNQRVDDYASSPPEALGMEFEGREAVRLQRFAGGGNQYTPNSVPASPFRIQTDVPRRIPHQSTTGIRDVAYDGDNSASDEAGSLPPRPPKKLNLRDGRVRKRPRGGILLAFILACLSMIFLGLVAHSFLNLQRDAKGCRMSFMYPSYAKLSDFDTEHTRFATKYSLYLYREQKMDLSLEVSPVVLLPYISQTVSQSSSSQETRVVTAKSVPSQQKQQPNFFMPTKQTTQSSRTASATSTSSPSISTKTSPPSTAKPSSIKRNISMKPSLTSLAFTMRRDALRTTSGSLIPRA